MTPGPEACGEHYADFDFTAHRPFHTHSYGYLYSQCFKISFLSSFLILTNFAAHSDDSDLQEALMSGSTGSLPETKKSFRVGGDRWMLFCYGSHRSGRIFLF